MDERLLLWSFCAMFFFLPFATSPTVITGLLGVAIWVFSGRIVRDWRCWLMQEWTIPVVLMIILTWLGLLWTQDPVIGHKLVGKSYYWLYSFAIASVSLRGRNSHPLFISFLAGLTFNAVVSILQLIGIMPLFIDSYGFMGYITYSLLLVFGLLLLSYYYKYFTGKKERIFTGLIMAIFVFNLVIVKGRSGYLAFILLLPLILANLFGTKYLIRIVFASLLMASALFLSPTVRQRVSIVPTEIVSYSHGNKDTSIGLRLYMWTGAVKIFMEHPLIGVGTGGYREALKKYKDNPALPDVVHPHNSFLHIAVSYGIVGLSIFAWLLFILLRKGWRDRADISGFAPLAFGLVFIIGSLTDSHILSMGTGNLFALMMGLRSGDTNKRSDKV